jgi:hypothetical protein
MKIFSLYLLILITSCSYVLLEQLKSYSIQNNYDVDHTIATNWVYLAVNRTCSLFSKNFLPTELVSSGKADFYTISSFQ